MNNVKKLNSAQKTIVGIQFLFVAFGATVLVPLLVGMSPSVALFTAGLGTLIFHLVTKGKVPIFWVVVLLLLRQLLRLPSYMVYLALFLVLWLWVLCME